MARYPVARQLFVFMLIALVAFGGIVHPKSPSAEAGPSYFFEDNFDGTTLDSSHWNASTNGGLTVSLDSGSLHMGQGGSSSLDFPYVSSVGTVFPPSGNFQVEIAAQYSQHGGQGDGIVVLGPDHQGLFILWGSGLVVALEGTSQVTVAGPLDPHNYRLTYVDGIASIYADNVHVLTAPLSVRPESLWLGTPTIGQVAMWPLWSGWVGIVDGHVDPTTAVVQSRWWYGTNWSPFSVDYIRVSSLSPPLANSKLPYAPGSGVVWTGGPHSLDLGGAFTADFAVGQGSGIDLAPTFQVLSIQAGTAVAVQSTCTEDGPGPLGCLVAIRHTDNTVAVYGHLAAGSLLVSIGQGVLQGTPLATSGSTGSGAAPGKPHLHLELRLGNATSSLCTNNSNCFGDPIDWDGLDIDGWRIYEYFTDGEGTRAYNYDGSAVRGTASVIPNFKYIDTGTTSIPRSVVARVGDVFDHSPARCDYAAATDCEDNSVDPNTQFAKLGDGGVLAGQASAAGSTWPPLSAGHLTSTNVAVASVGGIAELPNVAAAPLESARSSPDAGLTAGVVAGVASLGTALTAAAWYSRRRWASK
jgi:murein DD-endopeptidase MepM/ murein hydrolase activator NlpD